MEMVISILTALAISLAMAAVGLSIMNRKLGTICKRLEDLENGKIPDHEQAKAAAKAVNDFTAGIASIMGFDPLTALQKARAQEGGSE